MAKAESHQSEVSRCYQLFPLIARKSDWPYLDVTDSLFLTQISFLACFVVFFGRGPHSEMSVGCFTDGHGKCVQWIHETFHLVC